MDKNSHGGRREGSGRKPSGNPKKQITLYVETKSIYPFGNEDKMKGKLYDFIAGYGKPKEPVNGIQDLTQPTNEIKPYQHPKSNYSINTTEISPQALMQRYLEEKRECTDNQMWGDLLLRIEADDRLTSEQKNKLKNTL